MDNFLKKSEAMKKKFALKIRNYCDIRDIRRLMIIVASHVNAE